MTIYNDLRAQTINQIDGLINAGVLALTPDKQLTPTEFIFLLEMLTFKFPNKDYTDPNGNEYQFASLIFMTAIKNGWTRKEFIKSVDRFVLEYKFNDFNVAHILDETKRVKLMTYRHAKKNFDLRNLRCYKIDGVPFFQEPCDKILPFEIWQNDPTPDYTNIENNGAEIKRIVADYKKNNPIKGGK